VTLPLAEAIQGIKVTLADATVNKKKILPRLPEIKTAVKGGTLIYLPFRETVHEMIQIHTGLAINRKSLELGDTFEIADADSNAEFCWDIR
jgi:hypothetical protein